MQSNIKKMPKFLVLLFFTEMWERFSYYGFRALLVLFLTSKLGFTDEKSYLIYSLFAALSYIGAIICGTVADKWAGFRDMVFIGGIIITIGHMVMTLVKIDPNFIFLGLALITVGTSFFKGNITNLLGLCYNDSKERSRGFTIFYVGINIGSFLASISCAYVSSFFGWHYGFGLAGVGMVCGLLIFAKFSYILGDKGISPIKELNKKNILLNFKLTHLLFISGIIVSLLIMYLLKNLSEVLVNLLNYAGVAACFILAYIIVKLTNEQRKKILALIILVIFTMIAMSLEMQLGSLMNLFAKRNVVETILGFPVPAAVSQAINPFSVIIFGLIASSYFKFDKKYGLIKFASGLLCMALAFIVLYISCLNANSDNRVGYHYLFASISIIALSEVFMMPFIQERVCALSPNHLRGFMMGVLMLSLAFSNMAGILISKFASIPSVSGEVDNFKSLMIYKSSFLDIAKFNLGVFLIFLLLIPFINWLMNSSAEKIVEEKLSQK